MKGKLVKRIRNSSKTLGELLSISVVGGGSSGIQIKIP